MPFLRRTVTTCLWPEISPVYHQWADSLFWIRRFKLQTGLSTVVLQFRSTSSCSFQCVRTKSINVIEYSNKPISGKTENATKKCPPSSINNYSQKNVIWNTPRKIICILGWITHQKLTMHPGLSVTRNQHGLPPVARFLILGRRFNLQKQIPVGILMVLLEEAPCEPMWAPGGSGFRSAFSQQEVSGVPVEQGIS